MNTAFDTLSAAHSLEASGIETKQAEAIVQAIRSSGESAATRSDLDTTAAAGLLFAAIKLFGGAG